jgi:hypothetical protein
MTPELQAFIDHFSNEDQLRSAIEGLLSKREEFSGVRNLHGKDECGKDLVFYAPAGLGRPKLNACVVKLSKITGSASDPTSGARNVLIQCNQALDTPVTNTQGQEEWVSHVYVMCPNELSATAMQSVSGEFRGKPSQIEFVCGHDLLQVFRQSWPGFIFFQPDLLSAHLESLGKELEADTNIHRLAMAHGLSALTHRRNIYVEPALFQERGKLSRGARLIQPPELAEIASSTEMKLLRTSIDGLVTSLQVLDYLPPGYSRKRARARESLQWWHDRLGTEWSNAVSEATNEAYKRREPPPATVRIPGKIVDEFLNSEGYQFVAKIYTELDREIDDANASVAPNTDMQAALSSHSFANYGSLLHATTVCFPSIQFARTGQIEWSPEEIFSENRNILVTGAPGFGKTSFCRNHFLADLERFKTGRSLILPLYFIAHSIPISEGSSFEDVFVRNEVAAKLAADSTLAARVYLDGLDEVRSAETRDLILKTARNACIGENSRYRCVATARDHVGGYWTNWLVRVRLSPMSQERLKDLVTAWLDGDGILISRFYSELKNSESLLPVLGVPLLATLTVLVFKGLHRLPENKLRLYQMFIDLLLGGWNLAKGLQRVSLYSSTVKLLVITRLAGTMHAQKTKECTDSQISSSLKQVAPALLPDMQTVVGELVEDGLLLPTGRLGYAFPHLSFQEYLAAKDAIDPARLEERRVVQSYLAGDDWYKEVAGFLVSMTTNPLRMRTWIVDLAKPFASPNTLSDSETRAGCLLAKLSDAFPECRPIATTPPA